MEDLVADSQFSHLKSSWCICYDCALAMILRVLLTIAACITVVSAAHGNGVINLFQTTGPPGYFSGTNARLYATAFVIGAPYGITELRLYINEILVKVKTCPPGEPFLQHTGIGVRFDSTNLPSTWPGGTPCVVRAEADIGGETVNSQALSIPVKNAAHIFGRYDLEEDQLTFVPHPTDSSLGSYLFGNNSWAGTPNAEYWLALMGYSIGEINTSFGWPAATYIDTLTNKNVCYVNSHAGTTSGISSFWSDINDYHIYYPTIPADMHPQWAEEEITGSFGGPISIHRPILPRRTSDNGTGLPPFNSTGVPPINFVWVDGCKAGLNDELSTGFLYPYGNYYSPPPTGFPENQSLVTYKVDVYLRATADVTNALYEALHAGFTVHEARDIAWLTYKVLTVTGSRSDPTSATGWMAVFGDYYTRVNGVYSGTDIDSPQSGWIL